MTSFSPHTDLDALEAALERAQEQGQTYRAAVLSLAIGAWYLRFQKRDEAIEAYKRAEKLSHLCGLHSGESESALQLGQMALARGELVEAIECFERAIEAVKEPDAGLLGTLWHNMGFAVASQGDVVKAAGYYRQALDQWQRSYHPQARLDSLLGLGEALIQTDNCDEAAMVLVEAQSLLRQPSLSDPQREAVVGELHAKALAFLGRTWEAVLQLRRVRVLRKSLPDRSAHLRVMLSLAEKLFQWGREHPSEHLPDGKEPWQEGLATLRNWLTMVEQDGDEQALIYGNWQLAHVLSSLQQYRESCEVYLEVARLQRRSAISSYTQTLRKAAEMEVAAVMGNGGLHAVGDLNRALQIFEEAGDEEGVHWCRRHHLHIATRLRDWETALDILAKIGERDDLSPATRYTLFLHRVALLGRLQRLDEAAIEARNALELQSQENSINAGLERLIEAVRHSS